MHPFWMQLFRIRRLTTSHILTFSKANLAFAGFYIGSVWWLHSEFKDKSNFARAFISNSFWYHHRPHHLIYFISYICNFKHQCIYFFYTHFYHCIRNAIRENQRKKKRRINLIIKLIAPLRVCVSNVFLVFL